MVDKQLFLTGILEQVNGFQGCAYVRVITKDTGVIENDFLVRDIVKTYDGSVTLNVWLDIKGMCPIVSGSSSFHEFDVNAVTDYSTRTVPFEQILDVAVVPALTANGRFKVF